MMNGVKAMSTELIKLNDKETTAIVVKYTQGK